jgi:sugar phosphate permease
MLLIYGAMGALGTLLFFLLVKSRPPTPAREADTQQEITGWQGIRRILRMRNFLILGFIAFIGIGVFNGLATWLEKILNELHQIPMTSAGIISAALVLSGMVGCISIPLLSDRVNRRKPFLLLAAAMGAVSVVALMVPKGYALNVANGIVVGFFLISALPIMLTMSAEITGARFAGISVGYLQLLGNAAAVAIVPIMEFMRGVTGHWILPLAFIAGLLGIAFILALAIHEPIRSNQA